MKKIQLFLIVLLVGIQASFAQSVQVTGKVTYADDGAPVIGATINVKGTSVATLSDINGEYKLTIPARDNKIIVIAYTGLESQEVATPTSGAYNVSLRPDVLAADEVVVTGYGNVSRKNYAGSAAVVSTAKLKDVPSVSAASRLSGNVAGLTITSNSGQPGATEVIRIRGMGSINASNEPLIVLDGVPMLSGNASYFSGDGGYAAGGNSVLATINPADIETMTVIKDAAAASLYGSRAANGVIVITTKRGSAGKTRFNVKADVGFSDMAINWRPTLNGVDRRNVLQLGLYNYGIYSQGMTDAQATAFANKNINSFASPIVNTGENANDPNIYNDPNRYTDWRNLVLRQGLTQNYEVSAQGGNDKTKFYASMGYTDQKGIVYQQGYNRITGSLTLDHKQGIFTLNASSRFTSSTMDFGTEGTGYASPFMLMAAMGSPSDRAYNEDGSINTTSGFALLGGALSNPLWEREINFSNSKVTNSISNVSGQLDLFKGFSLKQTLGYTYMLAEDLVWWDPRSSNGGKGRNGILQMANQVSTRLSSQTMANYNRIFADVHSVSALVAWEAEDSRETFLYASGQNFPSYKKPALTNAATKDSDGYGSRSTLLSMVGKVDYTFDNRLYVGASYRRDGSSRLSPETRWGNFWSASAFWRISQERWFRDGGISRAITDARIRASYGENGTQPSEWYGWQGTYGFGNNYAGNPGIAENRIPNPELRWEKSLSTNIGLDVTFIDRITLGVDFYNRDTKDLIMAEPISQTTGFSTTLKNIGSMNNKGVEVTLSAVAIQTKDVTWNIGFNISHNKNTVTQLNDGKEEILNGNWMHRVGHSYYSLWSREYAGINSETGYEMWYTNDKIMGADGKWTGEFSKEITSDYLKANRILQDVLNPLVTGGLSTQFSYKWFDLGFTMTFALGGKALDGNSWGQGAGTSQYNYQGQLPSNLYDIDKMWKRPGDNATQQLFMYGSEGTIGSNHYLVSTDYLRLKNMTIGFSAPKEWTRKLSLEKIRIFASANNLFTIKDANCVFDPEVPIGSIVSFQAPQMRTVTFGIEIGF